MKPRYFNYFGPRHVNETKSDSAARNGSAQRSFRLNTKGIQEYSTSRWVTVSSPIPEEMYKIIGEDALIKACGWKGKAKK